MSRLRQLADNEASPAAADLFKAIKARVGFVPNLYRVTGNQPAVLGGLLGLGDALGKGSFDAKTREAIALAVAGANECDYCASAHSAISKGLKVDQAEITARLHGASGEPRLNAILKLAVAIVNARGRVADADLAAAREAGLDDAAIVETIGNVVANIFTNYLNHVADTEIDFPAVKAKAA